MWTKRFREPIRVDGLTTLRTLEDACAFVLALPYEIQLQPKWQNVAHLLVTCAQSRNSNLIAVTMGQLREAMPAPVTLTDALHKSPPRPSVKRRVRRKRKLAGLA